MNICHSWIYVVLSSRDLEQTPESPSWPLSPCCAIPRADADVGHSVTLCLPPSLLGSDNLYDGIEDMIGYRPGPWMKYSWAVVTPVLCVVSSALPGLWVLAFCPWGLTLSPAEPFFAQHLPSTGL